MAKQDSKFKKKKLGFTALPNHVLFDSNLDEDSVFLYAVIQYHITLPDFDLYKAHLVKLCRDRKIGQRKFERMWKNLKDVGYLKQYKMNGIGGEWYYEYELLDYPEPVENTTEPPDVQNVHVVENEDTLTPQNVDVQSVDVDIVDSVNVPPINKNILNKNILNKNNKTTTTTTSTCSDDIQYLIQTYEDNFGIKPNPAVIRNLDKYMNLIGVSNVVYGIEVAACKGKEFDYAIGVYMNIFKDTNKPLQ